MKSYYSAKDIQEITGCKKSRAYEIIRELQIRFEKKYPESIPIQGRIPIWYFEKVMMNREETKNEKEN